MLMLWTHISFFFHEHEKVVSFIFSSRGATVPLHLNMASFPVVDLPTYLPT